MRQRQLTLLCSEHSSLFIIIFVNRFGWKMPQNKQGWRLIISPMFFIK